MRKARLLPKLARVALQKLRELYNLLLIVLSSAVAQLKLVLTAKELDLRAARGQVLGLTQLRPQLRAS